MEYFASLATSFPAEASAVSAISAPPAISSAPQIDTAHQEEKASPLAPSRKAGFNKENRIATLFVVMILLLTLASGAVVSYSVQKANDAIVTVTAQANATAQVEANATATVQVEAAATAQAGANAAAVALANASPVAYPPHNQSSVLDDPFQDNSRGNNWEVDAPGNGNCKFINLAYNINTNTLEWCPARSIDFTNFIYEVQMKIVKGDGGGIAFRIDPTSESQFYYFVINQNGTYSVHAYGTFGNDATIAQGSSPAIHQGLNQTNLVAAVVHGTIIELYVNHQRVAVVGSSTYTFGLIGVIVTGLSNQTEVIFQNAKVWIL